jgi:hypothetical protein
MSSHIAQARDRLRGRRRAVIAAISICVLAVLAIVISTTGGSGSSASTDSPSTSTATVVIKRQDLVETDDEDGTLGYAGTRKVVNHLSGYVTWLPRQGSVIRPDHTLYSVDGTPVILLNGKLPTYRTLSSSVSGPDVRQLERNLRALGYDAGHDITIDDTWTSATTVAVKRWQDAHGLSQTGSIELGRVVFQPGPRRMSSLNATLGGSSSGSSGGGAASGQGTGASATTGEGASSVTTASSRASGVQAEAAVLRTAGATSTRTDGADQGTGTTTEPAPETKSPSPEKDQSGDGKSGSGNGKSKSKSNGASNGSGASGNGSSGASNGASGASSGASSGAAAPANEIMTTTSTRKIVTVELETTKSSLAKRGATVTVELPSGKTVHGRIASVGKVATSSSSDSTSGSSSSGSSSTATPTITLTIRLLSKATVLDQAPVTVGFEQSRVKDALAIPVTALLAQPGGKFAVEVVDGSNRHLVSVTPGAYTSGYVQISGAGLQPGMHVTNAEVR